MRGFLAALGATLLASAFACAPPALLRSAPEATVATPVAAPIVLLDETFAHAWPDDKRGNAWFADGGGYLLLARQPGEFVAVRAPLPDVPADVVVSSTFRKVGGPPGGGYGLILLDQGTGAGDGKDQSGQFVVAEVGDRGEIGVWRRDGTRWTDLVGWTASSAVHTDTTANDLRVQLVGTRLTFVVNGQQVAELDGVPVPGARPGRVGIFTGGDLNEVLVSHFRVQTQAPASPAAARADPGPAAAPQVPPSTPQRRASSDPPPAPPPPSNTSRPDIQRMTALFAGIADDIVAIAQSFAGGPNDPHDPVNDPRALQQGQARLASATAKAMQLLAEMRKLQNGVVDGR